MVRYAGIMAGVFRRGVELPAGGLLLRYERTRIVSLMMALNRLARTSATLPSLPYEMVIQIVTATVLTTPQYGIDPVHLFRWFWNRPPALDLVTRIVDPLPESPVQREPRDPEDGHKFVGYGRYMYGKGYRHWGIKSYPQRMPFPRDPADVPAMTWRDLSAVYIEYIAGSSMIHRMIDDTHKGAEGTATWYPDDIDIFVWSDHTVVLFERWLFSVFRRVVHADGTTTFEASEWQRKHRALKVSRKWTSGQLAFNMITNGKTLKEFDLPAAATHTIPPFNTVYTTFNPTGPFEMFHIVPRMADVWEHWGLPMGVGGITEEVVMDAAKRSDERVAKYKDRIAGLRVIPDHAGAHAALY